MRFAKGQSGNPGGRPKALVDVIEAARMHSAAAIATLARIAADTKAPPAAQVAAATALLDRAWGKPTQPVDANINVIDRLTLDEHRALAAALTALAERETVAEMH